MTIQTLDRPVGDIVADDFRTAAVFQRHRIDFCCGGKQKLAEACSAGGVDGRTLIIELAEATAERRPAGPSYAEWTATQLIEHIVSTHHAYVLRSIPSLSAWTQKVASAHGPRHPEVEGIAAIFQDVAAELLQHMQKEERILFPVITRLETGDGGHVVFGTVANPIRMMEHEHESAGEAFAGIRRLSRDYTLPEDACATFTVLYKELEAFERDLHVHIHLENNILFPKALALESGK
jgi:regulator of cell morphogenesis and NO signaling